MMTLGNCYFYFLVYVYVAVILSKFCKELLNSFCQIWECKCGLSHILDWDLVYFCVFCLAFFVNNRLLAFKRICAIDCRVLDIETGNLVVFRFFSLTCGVSYHLTGMTGQSFAKTYRSVYCVTIFRVHAYWLMCFFCLKTGYGVLYL